MKIRQGFVSNSSSSSFIVAVKNKTTTKITIETEIDLANYGKQFDTVEGFTKYYMYDQGLEADDLADHETYQNAKNAIENGFTIIHGSFSSDSGDAIEQMLCETGLNHKIKEDKKANKNIMIIESEGG